MTFAQLLGVMMFTLLGVDRSTSCRVGLWRDLAGERMSDNW